MTAFVCFEGKKPASWSARPISTTEFYTYVGNDPTNRTDPQGLCDDVVGCGPSAVQQEQVLNSPAGRQGELLGTAIGIGVGIGAAVCVEGGCEAAGAAIAKWAKSPRIG